MNYEKIIELLKLAKNISMFESYDRQCDEAIAFLRARASEPSAQIDLKEIITQAHMAGQIAQGVDPSWSDAFAYYKRVIDKSQEEKK